MKHEDFMPHVLASELTEGCWITERGSHWRVERHAPAKGGYTLLSLKSDDGKTINRRLPPEARVAFVQAGRSLPQGVVRFWQPIEVCIEAEHRRIDRVDYTKAQRRWLHKVTDCVAQGDWRTAFGLLAKVDRDWHEFLGIQISEILGHVAHGTRTLTDEQTKAWIGALKKKG